MRIYRILLGLAVVGLTEPASAALRTTNWTAAAGNLPNLLTAATHDGAGTFIAVGTNSIVVRGRFNQTGIVWTPITVPGVVGLRSVAYRSVGPGLFLAGGANDKLFSSANGGQTWNSEGAPFGNESIVAALAYSAQFNQFIAGSSLVELRQASAASALPTPWVDRTPASASFLESHRSATTYSNGLGIVVCGVRSQIRRSTDGGASWQSVNNLRIELPDLLGIASDGGRRLVAVGAKDPGKPTAIGRVFTSADAGSSWTLNSFMVSGKTLRAASHSGQEFVAVGSGGLILTSPDGSDWAELTSAVSADLHGSTFATNGQLKGVGMFVGASGTILLAGTAPPAPVSLGDRVVCQGSPNPPLQVSTTNSVGTNLVTVDWFHRNGMQVASGTNSFTPSDTFTNTSNFASNFTYYARARDLRTGFVSDTSNAVTLTVFPRPRATLETTNVICDGQSTQIVVKLTGIAPWTVVWSDGTNDTVTIPNADGGGTLVRSVSPTNAPMANGAAVSNYWVVSVSNDTTMCLASNLLGDIRGTNQIIINPRPTATLETTNTICDGQPTDLVAKLTGIAPWTVVWSDGTNQTLMMTNALGGGTLIRTVRPTNAPMANMPAVSNYWVVSVSNDTMCTANNLLGDILGTNRVIINPRPTAVVGGSTTNCNGDVPTIQAQLTGIGVWTLTWSDGYVQATNAPLGSGVIAVRPVYTNNPFANLSTSYTYTVTALEDTNCIAQAADLLSSSVVTLNPRPRAASISTNEVRNAQPTDLVVKLTGIGPWSVTWMDGTNQMWPTDGLGMGATLTRAVTLTNGDPNMLVRNPFWVTNIIDLGTSNQCSGTRLVEVTGTNVVIIVPDPTSFMAGSTNACDGDTNLIRAELTGLAPWTVCWSDGTVQMVTNVPPGSNGFAVRLVIATNLFDNLSTNVIYTVTNLTDSSPRTNLAGGLMGSNLVTIFPRPKATAFGNPPACEGDMVTIQAELKGVGPWSVAWSDGYMQTTNASEGSIAIIQRTVIATNEKPSLLFTNEYFIANVAGTTNLLGTNCAARITNLMGNADITVNPLPTAVVSGSTNICDGQSAVVKADLTGIGPWELVWAADNVPFLTNAYAASPAMVPNSPPSTNPNNSNSVVYKVVGLRSLSPNVTCANNAGASGTATVTINPLPTAVVSGSTNICDGQSAVVKADLTGIGPWELVWAADNVPFLTNAYAASPAMVPNSPPSTNPNNSNSVVYKVVGLRSLSPNVTCANNAGASGTATVTINPLPTAVVSGSTNICDGQSAVVKADLTGIGPWELVWAADNVPFLTNAYAASPAMVPNSPPSTNPNNSNSVVYKVVGLRSLSPNVTCANNAGASGTATVTINPLPTAVVSGSTNICDGQSAVVKADLTGIGPWELVWAADNVPFLTNAYAASPAMVPNSPPSTNPNNSNSVVYKVVGLRSLSPNVTCANNAGASGTATVTINPLPTAVVTVMGDTIVCSGQPVIVKADLTGIGPWEMVWTADNVPFLTNTYTASPALMTNSPIQHNSNALVSVVYKVAELRSLGTNLTCSVSPAGMTMVSVVACPTLSIRLEGTDAVLSWWGKWDIYSSDYLVPTNWARVPATPLPVAGSNGLTVPVPPPPAQKFFRLFGPVN